jgi:hypothetical protein
MLIPWVWYDLLDSHNFGKLCLLAISLVIAQGVVFSFLKSRWKALALWLISLIPVAGIVWENSRPIIEPHSHFTFFISTPDSNKIGLTNDLLIVKKANEFHAALGFLYVPIDDSQSNLSLKIDAQNDSASTAENVEIGILVPNDWLCVPDNGWMTATTLDQLCRLRQSDGCRQRKQNMHMVIRAADGHSLHFFSRAMPPS